MPSKHPNAAQLIRRGLYEDLRSFSQLEQRISALGEENGKVVGDALEVFVEGYLATQQKLQAENVWLVGQVPLDIRQQMNLPSDAKGIDGIFRTRTGSLVPYQVKFRSQRRYLTYTDIAPFLGLTERATDRIVFTNSNELAEDVKNRDAMRTVRGIDFDELTADELRAIGGWLRQQPTPIPQPIPHPYQLEALSRIAETLARADRAQVVMACGTGKTLLALWAVEQLKPKTVLVLVPSLTLLQQTLGEWSRNNSWGKDFTYLCVCSDPTVASKDEYDPVRLDAIDLEFRVDTDPVEVRRFIQRDTSDMKVVFSSYHSSRVVSEGVRGLPPFDVAVFDEAHKTTGPKGDLFAHCLSEGNIGIRKRLFFTATPRHYDVRHRNREGDFKIQSMDDPTIYGPRAYTLTFGSAAQQGIICNYKVVISVVDGQKVNDFALKYGITLVDGDLISAKWVANQIAIERAIKKTGATRVITFHSRVSSAEEFSTDSPRGIKQYLPEFSVYHVNGSQHSSERKQLIRDFREANKSLITNARCLTEGIDVPAVDMVAFIDPRHSKIDIAQATGRAMRKPRGSHKTFGYIVVPVFLEHKADETLVEALERSDFSDVADVLNALQEQDDDLIAVVRELKESLGKGEVFDPRRLSDKVEVLGPTIELSLLRMSIFAEVVNAIGVSWDEWYGRLRAYKDREGHCRVPTKYKEGKHLLGAWVSNQRKSASILSPGRRKRLDDLGFFWNVLDSKWENGFRYLKAYSDRMGNCRVPDKWTENGFRLGQWVGVQRRSRDMMPAEKLRRLDEVGFVWDAREAIWNEGYTYLVVYKNREGDCSVPLSHTENGFMLGQWVDRQRQTKSAMPLERRQQLEKIGFVWKPLVASWEKGFDSLKAFQEREGHCRAPSGHKENSFPLGQWVSVQRANRSRMSLEHKRRLDDIGFVWDTLQSDWEVGLYNLQKYRDREGHCLVPQRHKESNFPLGQWISVQRANKEKMSLERKRRLDDTGFVWDTLQSDWEEGLYNLQKYRHREGHCLVPQRHKENNFPLGRWVSRQRQNRSNLLLERRERLESLGLVWTALEENWENGFSYLQSFKDREGHCRVPRKHTESGFNLGNWVVEQRLQRNKMPSERRKRLDSVDFVWDPREMAWENGFEHLTLYSRREGHCRVPKTFKENGFELGSWVSVQRANKTNISAKRKSRLNALGFVWKRR